MKNLISLVIFLLLPLIGFSQIKMKLDNEDKFIISKNLFDLTLYEVKNNGSNVLLGENAGMNTNPTGLNAKEGLANTFIGTFAGQNNTKGYDNTFLGYLAGERSDSAYQNVILGSFAGSFKTSGFNNVFVGFGAGANNLTGSGNVFLGRGAGTNESGSDKLYIDNQGIPTPLIWGDFLNDTVKIYGTLGIRDNYFFPNLDGSAGQVLKTDGNGNVSWGSNGGGAIGINDLSDAILANLNLFGGTNAGINTLPAGTGNTSWGINSMEKNTSGIDNTAVGRNSLRSNTIGAQNIAIGTSTMVNNTEGFSNIAIGSSVLHDMKTGAFNIGIGQSALLTDTSGYHNTAIGAFSQYQNQSGLDNVSLGNGTLENNILGDANVAIGFEALKLGDSLSNNVAIGRHAGYNNDGDSNVFIGFSSGFSEVGSDMLYIENSGSSSPLIWGDFANDTVKIYGTLGIRDEYYFPDTIGSTGQVLEVTTGGKLEWNTNSEVTKLDDLSDVIHSNSNLYAGTNSGINSLPAAISNTAYGFNSLVNNTSGFSNTAIGRSSMLNNKNGVQNVAVGSSSLNNNVSGQTNIAIGNSAIFDNKTGHANIGIGASTMSKDTSSSNNVAIGNFSQFEKLSGEYNVSLGNESMMANTFGNKNVAIGHEAFSEGDSLSFNVGLGHRAGQYNEGEGNVFIGFSAGSNEMGSDKLYIENSVSPTPLIWGDFANDSLKVYGTLGIKDEFSFPDTDGSANQIMRTDGNGNLSWQTLNLVGALNDLSDSKTDYAVDNNLFIGDEAGMSIQAGGALNTAFGIEALKANTTGDGNTGLGYQTLLNNTEGFYNTAVGVSALKSLTTGDFNTSSGYGALEFNQQGNQNSAYGYYALYQNSIGDLNTALGTGALYSNTAGDNNTAVGNQAGFLNIGDDNVFLGNLAGYKELGSDKLYIDNDSTSTPLIWGDFFNNYMNVNGRQGINTSAPQTSLHIKQELSNQSIRMEFNSDTDYWDTYIDASDDYNFAYNGILKGYIKDTDGAYIVASDRRLKSNIREIENVLPGILQLNPTTYFYKADNSQDKQIGLIAQEVQQLFPEAVNEKNGYLGVNYSVFSVLAIEAIKEQQELIDKQDEKINQQNDRIAELEAKLGKVMTHLGME